MYTFEIPYSPKLQLRVEGMALQLAFENPEALFDLVEQLKELELGILQGLGYGEP